MTRYMYIETYTVSRSSVIIRSGRVAFNPVSGVAFYILHPMIQRRGEQDNVHTPTPAS
jgi:hypothetical protein